MKALYDLSIEPTTWDFILWSCIAKTNGATEVHFGIPSEIAALKYSADVAWKRFGNITVPLCTLAELPYIVASHREGQVFNHRISSLMKLYAENGSISKLPLLKQAKMPSFVTVTLRDSWRNTHRNSNKETWPKFIKWLEQRNVNVLVHPECESRPIDVMTRMKSYSNAKMNFGVEGGPMGLCTYSDAPYVMFCLPCAESTVSFQDRERHGFPMGSQFPWKTSRQQIVYAPDSLENLTKHYLSTCEEEQCQPLLSMAS